MGVKLPPVPLITIMRTYAGRAMKSSTVEYLLVSDFMNVNKCPK